MKLALVRAVITLAAVLFSLLVAGGSARADDAGSISGTVTDASGQRITSQDICVVASPVNGDGRYDATSDANGDYTVAAVPPGTYDVVFSDCADSPRDDVLQYYGGAAYARQSTTVAVTAGGDASGIDAQLAAGTSISGHVYGGAGTDTPLGNVCVTAEGIDGNEVDPIDMAARSDSSGAYTLSRMPAQSGGYHVRFAQCTWGTYIGQWYGGDNRHSTASAVPATVAAPATGIDAHLVTGGTISGTITDATGHPLANVCAEAYLAGAGDPADVFIVPLEQDDASGAYSVAGLPTGSYTIVFGDCSPGNDLSQTVGPVSVTAGQNTTGVDVALASGATISGHVYGGDGTGNPLAGSCVAATAVGDHPLAIEDTGSGTVGANGAYVIRPLVSGKQYIVQFNSCAGGPTSIQPTAALKNLYAPLYYGGVESPTQAQVLIPTVAAPSTGIDAHLPLGPAVTTITGGPRNGGVTSQHSSRFSFISNLGAKSFECSLDGAPFRTCASPYDTGTVTAGRHTFAVRETAAGYPEALPPTVSWTVDPSSPESDWQGEAPPVDDLLASDVVSTDPLGRTSSDEPVIVTAQSLRAAQMTVTARARPTTPSANGYTVFGPQVDISLADFSGRGELTPNPYTPYTLQFTLDASRLPSPGAPASSITVTRDGVPAPACTVTIGSVFPEICVQALYLDSARDLHVEMFTTGGGAFNFVTRPGTSTTWVAASKRSTKPTAKAVEAALRRLLASTGAPAEIRRLLAGRRETRTFTAPSAGALAMHWYVSERNPRAPGRARRVSVLAASARSRAVGKTLLTLHLRPAARRRLTTARRVIVTVTASFKPAGETARSASRRVTVAGRSSR